MIIVRTVASITGHVRLWWWKADPDKGKTVFHDNELAVQELVAGKPRLGYLALAYKASQLRRRISLVPRHEQ
jgi:hypothetical protein